MLDTEYRFIIGRKGISREIQLIFDKKDCYHLMGLQYLTDRPELSRDRGAIFDEIMTRVISRERIESSDLYIRIQERINALPLLEQMLDSNDTIFKYNKTANTFSKIQAEFLLKNKLLGRNIFLFLSKNFNNQFFCRSFFPETKIDYSYRQASWTLLHKKKINRLTGTEVILYDRKKIH